VAVAGHTRALACENATGDDERDPLQSERGRARKRPLTCADGVPVGDEVIRGIGVQLVLLNINIALTWTNTVRLGRFELPTPALGERCSIP
jgi:hypothetical protein